MSIWKEIYEPLKTGWVKEFRRDFKAQPISVKILLVGVFLASIRLAIGG